MENKKNINVLEKIAEYKKMLDNNDALDLAINFCDYSNGYIDEITNEIADNNTDIYTYDALQWMAENSNNYVYVEEYINEYMQGCETNLIDAIRGGQFLYNQEKINDNLENILIYYSYVFLKNNGIEKISEETNDTIESINIMDFENLNNINNSILELIENNK